MLNIDDAWLWMKRAVAIFAFIAAWLGTWIGLVVAFVSLALPALTG